jgi:LemA protein
MSSALLGWLGLLAVLGLWALGVHNRITRLRAAILSAWALLEQSLVSRARALSGLLQAVAEPLASESAALEAVASAQAQVLVATEALRRRPLAHDKVAELSKADAVLAAVLIRLVSLVEQQGQLLTDVAVQTALLALRELPPRLIFARQTFNAAGSAYNLATQQFPTRLLSSLLRFGQAGQL